MFRDGQGTLSFRVLDCPDKAALIQVDEKGYLSSGSLTGTASLQITSQETFGVNQTVILAVKVRISLNLTTQEPKMLLKKLYNIIMLIQRCTTQD